VLTRGLWALLFLAVAATLAVALMHGAKSPAGGTSPLTAPPGNPASQVSAGSPGLPVISGELALVSIYKLLDDPRLNLASAQAAQLLTLLDRQKAWEQWYGARLDEVPFAAGLNPRGGDRPRRSFNRLSGDPGMFDRAFEEALRLLRKGAVSAAPLALPEGLDKTPLPEGASMLCNVLRGRVCTVALEIIRAQKSRATALPPEDAGKLLALFTFYEQNLRYDQLMMRELAKILSPAQLWYVEEESSSFIGDFQHKMEILRTALPESLREKAGTRR